MFKHKLLIVPTILLSSTLLLSGCGANEDGNKNSPTSSSASAPETMPGYVAPPSELSDRYKSFYGAPQTLTEEGWASYANLGATTHKEDPSDRSTTLDDWKAAQVGAQDGTNVTDYTKMFGEMTSDLEHSTMNVSEFLAANPDATLDTINATEGLLVNRYPNLGATKVEQETKTGFYFVIMTFDNLEEGMEMGLIVPQEGITPDELAPPSDDIIITEEESLDS